MQEPINMHQQLIDRGFTLNPLDSRGKLTYTLISFLEPAEKRITKEIRVEFSGPTFAFSVTIKANGRTNPPLQKWVISQTTANESGFVSMLTAIDPYLTKTPQPQPLLQPVSVPDQQQASSLLSTVRRVYRDLLNAGSARLKGTIDYTAFNELVKKGEFVQVDSPKKMALTKVLPSDSTSEPVEIRVWIEFDGPTQAASSLVNLYLTAYNHKRPGEISKSKLYSQPLNRPMMAGLQNAVWLFCQPIPSQE